jgi:predicted nucleic acid-binding protein
VIIIDTSAIIEFLTGEDDRAERVRAAVAGESLAAPHCIDLESASALRGMVNGRKLDRRKADLALEVLQQLELNRYEHTWYLPRIWELRQNMWPYDAAYAALAEALAVPLLSVDCKFEQTPGLHCEIITIKAEEPVTGEPGPI